MANQPLLEVLDLNLECSLPNGETQSLVRALNLRLMTGESLGLLGESGSGKSLTALSLLGLLPEGVERCGGVIRFRGQELQGLSESGLQNFRGGKIALIFQDPGTALNPVLRVGYQVEEVLLQHRSLNKSQRAQELLRLFEEVRLPNPAEILRRYPHELSGGQRQRVMIAMALAGEPDLLIADEPTTALDVTVQAEILKLVQSIRRQRQLAILWISHDLGVLANCCERLAVLYRGDLIEEGSVEEVLAHPSHEHTRFLLDSIPGKDPVAKISEELSSDNAKRLLEVKNLTVKYPAGRNIMGKTTQWFTAVDDLSLNLNAGETLAIVGESGSGKTTLGRALLRLLPAAAGSADFRLRNGKVVDLIHAEQGDLHSARKEMSLIFQDPYASLNPLWKVEKIIAEPLEIHSQGSRSEIEQRVVQLIDQVQLPAESINRRPAKLSGGQRQRVAIARALALNPALIICDEAVSALDLGVQAAILDLLTQLQKQLNLAFLFITHDLGVVQEFADRIAVMKDSRIVETGSVAEVFSAPKHTYTQRLLAAAPKIPTFNREHLQ